MGYGLFLDDNARTPGMESFRYPPDDGSRWFIAISSAEAIEIVKEQGLPAFMSLDHDLGENDTAMVFLKWMYEYMYDSSPPDYIVHSQNGEGAKNIIAFMDSWKKSME